MGWGAPAAGSGLSSLPLLAPSPSPFPQLYYQVLNFGMIVSSALMIWKGLMVVTGSESPIVVVLRYSRGSAAGGGLGGGMVVTVTVMVMG